MKYSVKLRTKGLFKANQYLISCEDTNDLSSAFVIANELLIKSNAQDEYFAEIVDNTSGEKIAGINDAF